MFPKTRSSAARTPNNKRQPTAALAMGAVLLLAAGPAFAQDVPGLEAPLADVPPAPDPCATAGADCSAIAAAVGAAEGEADAQARAALLAGPVVVWTNKNMGSQSGLDADALDGYSSEWFVAAIDREAAARKAADDALKGALDAEALARSSADAALTTRVAKEEATRESAVSSLSARATFLEYLLNGGTILPGHVRITSPYEVDIHYVVPGQSTFWEVGTNWGGCDGGKGFYFYKSGPKACITESADMQVAGHIYAHGGAHVGDVAEPVVAPVGVAAGDVVVADGFTPEGMLKVRKATTAFDRGVIGIVSTNPSLHLAGLPTDTPLAVTGIVPVKVSGPVAMNDLLTSSAVAGHAMSCEPAACGGAILGKALEAHAGPGAGVIRVMVTLG